MNVQVAYWDHPDQVIWIDLPRRRLQGFDNYWVDSPYYGVFNDPENMGTMYEGRQGVAWSYIDGVEVELDHWVPPTGVEIYRGYMLTDEQAKFVGLI